MCLERKIECIRNTFFVSKRKLTIVVCGAVLICVGNAPHHPSVTIAKSFLLLYLFVGHVGTQIAAVRIDTLLVEESDNNYEK